MEFGGWLLIGVLIIFGFWYRKENRGKNSKFEDGSSWQDDIDAKRRSAICRFKDGITYDEFSDIAYKSSKRIKRIKEITINGAAVFCTVESQTGYSVWEFNVDFNNWGHVTGTYWKNTENSDSNIPKRFGDMVSESIQELLNERSIILPDFSDYVENNKNLNLSSDLSYSKVGLFKKFFSRGKYVKVQVGSQDLVGEHTYVVVSILRSSGFKNIKSMPIKDVGKDSNKYVFEVEQVVIGGISVFEIGEMFPENEEVIITYHAKQEIKIQFENSHFKKKNYIAVGDQLQNMGFSNIYERKIEDLVTGFLTKNGAVEEVLVEIRGKEQTMNENQPYDFDTKIIIAYHTFPNR